MFHAIICTIQLFFLVIHIHFPCCLLARTLHETDSKSEYLLSEQMSTTSQLLSTPEPWEEITLLHNSYRTSGDFHSSKALSEYDLGKYKSDDIHSLVVKSLNLSYTLIRKTLNSSFLFTPLVNKMLEKCIFNKHSSDMCFLNVAFFGGSVTYGSSCSATVDDNMLCAWPHRFVHFANKMLQILWNKMYSTRGSGGGGSRSLSISPRYCAVGGRDTSFGLNMLKSRLYKECYMNVSIPFASQKYDARWEPDLIIWDYSVNDQVVADSEFVDIYENFISYAMHHLPTRPQMLSVEFIGSSNNNLLYFPPLLQSRIMLRQAVNEKYHVPAINYPGLFPNYVTPRDTIFMAAEKSPHPAWPTHTIWAHILTIFLFFHLQDFNLSGTTSLYDVPWMKQQVDIGASSFCLQGFVAYLDFSLVKFRMPVNVVTRGSDEWRLMSDSPTRSNRRGYIYVKDDATVKSRTAQRSDLVRQRNVINVKKPSSTYNFIQFTCSRTPNLALNGMVSIGYMESYGMLWANAVVSLKYHCLIGAHIKNGSKTDIISPPPFTLRSNSNRNISVLKEYQYDPTLSARSRGRFNHSGVCPVGSELYRVQVTMHVKENTGSKFKLLSLGFC